MDILNFGSLNIDFVYGVDEFIRPGETKLSDRLSIFCGGKGLNQSIAAARAGNRVYHACLMGEDGGILLDKLKENGVDTSNITPITGKSGHAIIQVDSHGQNCILLYGGSNRALTREYIDRVLEAFAGKNVMLMLQNELNMTGYIIDRADSLGIPVALNAAPMNEAVKDYPLNKLTWLIVNEIEGGALAGSDDEAQILDLLEEKYPNCSVLLTLGGKGALCRALGRTVRVPACHVQPVDTTAAGDTFTGYFLKGVLNGQSIEKSLAAATVASAICVQRAGASDSVPLWAEVEEALASGKFGQPEAREV